MVLDRRGLALREEGKNEHSDQKVNNIMTGLVSEEPQFSRARTQKRAMN